MTARPLLICYAPGARGDFLAAVLLNLHPGMLAKTQVLLRRDMHYTKLHLTENGIPDWARDLTHYHSVRIKLCSVWDKLTCLHRWRQLELPWQPEVAVGLAALDRAEQQADQLRFDWTVPFSALHSVNTLVEWRRQYSRVPVTAEWRAAVQQGIALQPRITQENYQEYFPGWVPDIK